MSLVLPERDIDLVALPHRMNRILAEGRDTGGNEMISSMPTVCELFCGAGGMGLGCRMWGWSKCGGLL